MFYIVYKTTNVITKRYYIGAHKTADLDDGYLGSGKLIKQAIQKYGKENFSREVLFYCVSEKEMFLTEGKIVNKDILNDPLSYNLCTGGLGGQTYTIISDEDLITLFESSVTLREVFTKAGIAYKNWNKLRLKKLVGENRYYDFIQHAKAYNKKRTSRFSNEERKMRRKHQAEARKTANRI